MMQTWISGVLGLVLIVVAFLDLSEIALAWTLVVLGAVIAVLSFWASASEDHKTHIHHHTARTQY